MTSNEHQGYSKEVGTIQVWIYELWGVLLLGKVRDETDGINGNHGRVNNLMHWCQDFKALRDQSRKALQTPLSRSRGVSAAKN